MALSIGETLKKYRNMNKISVKEISDLLSSHGYKASESTIYSWENDNSQPTPGAFLLMCKAYNIDSNILEIFGYGSINKKSDLLLNIDEINHIKKYRNLDNHGKEAVNSILEVEHKRHIKNTTPKPAPPPKK